MIQDTTLHIKLRLFDQVYDISKEIGKYENVMANDLNVEGLVREVKQTFSRAIKQFETDVNNLKKGEL